MIETRAQFPQREDVSEGLSRDAADKAARATERRTIGRELHQGILQELTVAGFKLKAMQSGEPAASAAAIADFANWLRDRQADLRRYVTSLEQGLDCEIDLARVAADLTAQYGLKLSIDPPLQSSPDISGAIVQILRDVAPLLAGALHARKITIALEGATRPALRIVHDGRRIYDHAAELAALRSSIGRNGASLQIEDANGSDAWILDWAG
jgi:hypothetical protein